jgi:lysophospholipase L1-like esterase
MASVRFVAIGDSFTEGLGDELPDGTLRGWADITAQAWADATGEQISYANLSVRGKLVWPIVQEQLEPALALRPTHLAFNGGGNDVIRPRTTIPHIVDAFSQVVKRCDEEGVQLIVLSGANPAAQLPLSRLIQRRGDQLSDAVVARLADRPDIIRALNWPDRELAKPAYWAPDRLHMNARGHHRVAARVLTALGFEPPAEWWSLPEDPGSAHLGGLAYYRTHVGPWVRRRLTGRSSGDGRVAKYGDWMELVPQTLA